MALVDKIIWQLERHMTQPLTIDALASLCAVSPYHMVRAFRAGTGQTPMGYLRARRLSEAARALAYGADDILQVGLEAGYGSHEAFTRAFSAAFGDTPSAVRAAGDLNLTTLQEALIMTSDQFIDLSKPTLQDMPAITVAGYAMPSSQARINEIPPVWEKFNRALDPAILDLKATYGICYDTTPDGDFIYMAAAGDIGADLPDGMTRYTIPAGRYAVFEHKGHVSDMPRMFNTIWNKVMPDSDLTPRDAPEYELYDHRFDPQTGRGTLVVAIPVE